MVKINNSSNSGQLLKTTSSVGFANVTLGDAGALRTGTTDQNTIKIQAYDVDGTAYTDLLTAKAGNTPTLVAGVDLDFTAGDKTIGASIGANNLTLGGATSTVIIPGDLTVQGTTTTIDTENLNVKDKNISVNLGGTTAGTTGAGLDILGDSDAVVGYLKIADSDNSLLEIKTPGNAGVLTLDINATKTLTIAGALDIEADSKINQDLTTDATEVQFAGLKLTGDIDLTTAARGIDLVDNNASALSFDAAGKVGILEIDTTDDAEGIKLGGYLQIGGSTAIDAIIDDDTMATASDTNVATAESVKAFVENSISVASSFAYTEVTATSANIAATKDYNSYTANNAELVTLSLPATCAAGKIIEISGKGAGGWKVAQAAGQTIHFGDVDSTVGVVGYLSNTERYDSVTLKCIVADTEFVVIGSMGNIEIE